ncbi:roadblock/LC7 domain-containing protein [Streptomyces sp. CFMR 7]|uniref:roadblock/LC7 domain-containing protein n=1 Tax=Streptomyces sp. CFMR 7 TaxID=1649184 RepID=UPI00119E33AB|nr:roadblock/LC7 domain-containing protein [Streptomyces sp. CFMR 7]
MGNHHSQQPTADTHDLSWYLNQLAAEPGVLHALLLSSDGLKLAVSDGVADDVAERTAANASAAFAVGRGIAEFARDTAPKKIIIDMDDSSIFVFGAGHGTLVVVSASGDLMSKEAGVAAKATIKAIAGIRPVLSTRVRTA